MRIRYQRDVTAGDWATLRDGTEVMVAWQSRGHTNVRIGDGEPKALPGDTEVCSVRVRGREPTDDKPVPDPLSGAFGAGPLFGELGAKGDEK